MKSNRSFPSAYEAFKDAKRIDIKINYPATVYVWMEKVLFVISY